MSTTILTASNVTMIPANRQAKSQRKIRAACYARVSSEQDSQQLSYATQKNYFIDYINNQEMKPSAARTAPIAFNSTR